MFATRLIEPRPRPSVSNLYLILYLIQAVSAPGAPHRISNLLLIDVATRFESHPLRHSFVFSGLDSFLKPFPKTSSIRLQKTVPAVLGVEGTHTMGISRYTLYLDYAQIPPDPRRKPEFRPHQFFLSGSST
jgi:hypothetical protein